MAESIVEFGKMTASGHVFQEARDRDMGRSRRAQRVALLALLLEHGSRTSSAHNSAVDSALPSALQGSPLSFKCLADQNEQGWSQGRGRQEV